MTARSRSQVWLLPLMFTLIGVLSASQIYIQVTSAGMRHSFWRILGLQVVSWSSWALLAPALLRLKSRVPIVPLTGKSLALYAGVGALVAALHVAIAAAASRLFDPYSFAAMGMSGSRRLMTSLTSALPEDLVICAAIFGVAFAADSYDRYRDRELKSAQLEAQLSAARLSALSLQIQPHFLFNTLNSVAALVRAGENAAAVRMIALLGDMVRHTLEDSRPEIPLADELAVLDRYLEIQEVRFGKRMEVRRAIEPQSLNALVPSFILQPLAENALRHGIEQGGGHGVIDIAARRRDGRLLLEIRDSGPGPPPEQRRGIGLSVTEERLRASYGEEGHFRLSAAPGGGAAATIDIPWRDAD